MARIAFIDTGINTYYLEDPNRVTARFVVSDGRCDGYPLFSAASDSICNDHGTMCARIFEHYAGDCEYQIIDIKVLNSIYDIEDSENIGKGNINDLNTALELCLDLKADIISMSLGSSLLSDSRYVRDTIDKLNQKGTIIVAANSNSRKLSVPAVFPEVFGVEYDIWGILKPREILYCPNDPLRIDTISAFEFEDELPSNSYAVPIVTARINKYICEGKNTHPEIVQAFIDDCNKFDLFTKEKYMTADAPRELPHIKMITDAPPIIAYEYVKDIMDCLTDKHDCECACLCDMDKPIDCRFFDMRQFDMPFDQVISVFEQHADLSVLFSIWNTKDEFDDIDADVTITIKNGQTLIINDEGIVIYDSLKSGKNLNGTQAGNLLANVMK